MDVNTLTVVQARMSSSRFPGKTLVDLNGKPVLQHVIDRLVGCTQIGHIVVATSTDPSDDPIVKWCDSYSVDVFRGSLDDVVDRFHKAAQQYAAHTVVRVTADCPLLDPELLDRTVNHLVATGADYCDTTGWPAGVGQEAFTRGTLFRCWQQTTRPDDREHVVPWMIRNSVCASVVNDTPFAEPRVTLDTPADLKLLKGLA